MAVYLIYPHPPAVLHMNMPSSGYTGGGGTTFLLSMLIIQFYSHKCYHMYMNLRAKASCAIVDNPACPANGSTCNGMQRSSPPPPPPPNPGPSGDVRQLYSAKQNTLLSLLAILSIYASLPDEVRRLKCELTLQIAAYMVL